MESFRMSGQAKQVFQLLEIKTKCAHDAARELKEMQFDKMVNKGLPDPYDLKHLYDRPGNNEVHPCVINYKLLCSRSLNDSCQGCPIYKDIDGE